MYTVDSLPWTFPHFVKVNVQKHLYVLEPVCLVVYMAA
jgi:hypothetical protein